jgi:hypothetical protein
MIVRTAREEAIPALHILQPPLAAKGATEPCGFRTSPAPNPSFHLSSD